MAMEWSNEAQEFLDSRRAKIPGKATEIDLAIDRIRKDSEKAASTAGVGLVEKEHVKLAITGLPKIEVVTEATEGSFAFVRVLIILGIVMLFVGLVIEVWYRNLAKYGEEPTESEDIFILRYMLYVGIIMLVAAGILFWNGKREKAEEWEEEEPLGDEVEGSESEEASAEGEEEEK